MGIILLLVQSYEVQSCCVSPELSACRDAVPICTTLCKLVRMRRVPGHGVKRWSELKELHSLSSPSHPARCQPPPGGQRNHSLMIFIPQAL